MQLDTQEQRIALYRKYPLYFEERVGKHWTAKKLACATMYLQGGTTLEKVGKEYGISKERVRQIVVAFLRKVRDDYMRNKTAFRAMEIKNQQTPIPVDALDTAILKLGDAIRRNIQEEVEQSVRRQLDMLMATKYPSRLAQEPLPARTGYSLAETTEILDTSSNEHNGSLKRLAVKFGRTESAMYNIRSNYRKWKETGGSPSYVLDKLFEQYEAAKQGKEVKEGIGNSAKVVQTKGDASLPEMSDPEADGIIGYYMDDIKVYLGTAEKIADFEQWFQGRTGGIYDNSFYVLKSDFQEYLESKGSKENSGIPTPPIPLVPHFTKAKRKNLQWSSDEIEVALDAKPDEIHEVAELLDRTFDSVKSLRWRYRVFKNGQGENTLSMGVMRLFEQYEKQKGLHEKSQVQY